MRVMLVDGTNNFIRNYMVNTSTTENSVPCGGTVGFMRSLVSAMKTIKPNKVIIVWDGPNGSRQKRDLLKEYKNGRKTRLTVGQKYSFQDSLAAEKNKEWQQNLTISLLKYLPVIQIVTSGYEADDAIGYICTNYKYFDFDSCIILTSDKDYYQLLNSAVAVFNPIKSQLITKKSLIEEAETHPDNWLFYKSIVGDKSDNIKGIKGIGDKTLKKIFNMSEPFDIFEVLDSEVEEEDDWRRKKIQQFKENIETIKINMKLMDLRSPLMSISQKDDVTSIVKEGNPPIKSIPFHVEIKKFGIPIDSGIDLHFRNLS